MPGIGMDKLSLSPNTAGQPNMLGHALLAHPKQDHVPQRRVAL